jgi:hypothetical protein
MQEKHLAIVRGRKIGHLMMTEYSPRFSLFTRTRAGPLGHTIPCTRLWVSKYRDVDEYRLSSIHRNTTSTLKNPQTINQNEAALS